MPKHLRTHTNAHRYSNTILATLNARAGFRSGSSVRSSSAQGRSLALWEGPDTSLNFATGRSGTATTTSVMVTTTRRMMDEHGNEMQMVVLPQSVSVAPFCSGDPLVVSGVADRIALAGDVAD